MSIVVRCKGADNVIFTRNDVEIIGSEAIEKLKDIARVHAMRRARICLHHDIDDLTHEMIIVAHRSTYMRPHRHPAGKSESYHVIEGEMDVNIFNTDGELDRVIHLVSHRPGMFMYRVTNAWWHQPVPKTDWVVYHETYSGPFQKDIDVEYASWAPEEAHEGRIA
jgi:cupin fold WbuC family metalloprotein